MRGDCLQGGRLERLNVATFAGGRFQNGNDPTPRVFLRKSVISG
jgi:hypothetical protein